MWNERVVRETLIGVRSFVLGGLLGMVTAYLIFKVLP